MSLKSNDKEVVSDCPFQRSLSSLVHTHLGIMNYINTKAKCLLKNLPVNGTLLPPPPPTLNTVYVHVIINTEKGGGGERTREKVEKVKGATVHRAGSKITNMTECVSTPLTLINTCRKVPLQVNSIDDDILLWCL